MLHNSTFSGTVYELDFYTCYYTPSKHVSHVSSILFGNDSLSNSDTRDSQKKLNSVDPLIPVNILLSFILGPKKSIVKHCIESFSLRISMVFLVPADREYKDTRRSQGLNMLARGGKELHESPVIVVIRVMVS